MKLKKIIKEWAYGILPPGNSYNSNNPITFIRATEMSENLLIDFSNTLKVPKKYYQNKRSRLQKWDILIAVKWATIASRKCIWFIDKEIPESIVNGSIFRFQVIEWVNAKYIAYYLDSDEAKKQMKFSLVANNAVDYLNKDVIENLQIPLPPLELQQQIVQKMDQALSKKQKLETESKEILENIDQYILWELGIEILEQQEKMCFGVNFEEVVKNKRIDPFYFQNIFHIEKSKYDLKYIFDIAEVKKWQSITQKNVIDWDYPVIAGWQTSPYNHNQKNYDWNVITVSASWAYSWYVWYHDYPIFASDCSVVFSKNETKISTKFIYIWLKANQKEIYKMQKWAWQPHVYPDDIWNFLISFPPIEIQNKITDEVDNRTREAKNKEQQAQEIYKNAKKEIEEMILD